MAEDEEMTDGAPVAPLSAPAPALSASISVTASNAAPSHSTAPASIAWDAANTIPLANTLRSENDIIVLLTPVAVHPDGNPTHSSDPFEPLGRAIADLHPMVRHVPYTKTGGITSTHTAFIQRASVVIFVATGLPANENEPSQLEYADIVRVLCENRILIVLACFDFVQTDVSHLQLPTLIHARSYTPVDLQAAAKVMFTRRWSQPASPSYRPSMPTTMQPAIEAHEQQQAALASQARMGGAPMVTTAALDGPPLVPGHQYTSPQVWDLVQGDIAPIFALWQMCMPNQFWPHISRLEAILRRPGYATHYIVRTNVGAIIGFCATFVNYLSHLTEDFAGSIAIIIVHPDYRRQGIGTMLHECAYAELENNPKVVRIQLGSTFPRLLYGVPSDNPSTIKLFKNLGWDMESGDSGQGLEVTDWLLDFTDLPGNELSSAGLTFKSCEVADFFKVLALVESVAMKKDYLGWYEQYAASNHALDNIIVGMEGTTVVTVGLLYYPGLRTVTDLDLPWAEKLGADVGGLTCICIKEPDGNAVVRPDAIMIRLLDKCVRVLRERGKRKLFIDASRGSDQGFLSLGFRKWASYRELHHDIRTRSLSKPPTMALVGQPPPSGNKCGFPSSPSDGSPMRG